MPNVSLGGVSFTGCNFASGDAKWCESLVIGGKMYEKAFPDGQGVDGTGVKRHGFRERRITLNCYIMGGSEDGAFSNALAALDAVPNEAFDCVVGGETFPRCELDPGSSYSEPRKTEHGTFYCRAVFIVLQKGLE